MFRFNDQIKNHRNPFGQNAKVQLRLKSFTQSCLDGSTGRTNNVIELNVTTNGQLIWEGCLHINMYMKTSKIFHFLLGAQIRVVCISYKYDWFMLSFRIRFDIHWLFRRKRISFWKKTQLRQTFISSYGIFIDSFCWDNNSYDYSLLC